MSSTSTEGVNPGSGHGRIVGRESLLNRLDGVLDAVSAGRGGLTVLAGEPGIGKTRLAEETVRRARDQGFRTAWAVCSEDGTAPGFWPITQWVKALLAADPELAESLGVASRLAEVGSPLGFDSDAAATRFALFDAVLSMLRAASTAQLLLLVLDDVQWADASTLALLQFLAGHLSALPVAVVATCRSRVPSRHDTAPALAELLADATLIEVAGLDEADLTALVEDIVVSSVDAETIAMVRERSDGNPLYATEIARMALHDAGALAGNRVPDTLRELLLRRYRNAPPGVRDLLDVAAVIGVRFDLPDLIAIYDPQVGPEKKDLDDDPVAVALDIAEGQLGEAVALGCLEQVGGGPAHYAFPHVLFRDAIYQDLGIARRVTLHEHVADALAELAADNPHDYDPAELAYHYVAATPAGRAEDAVSFLRAAGAAATQKLACEDAVRHYSTALEVLDSHPDAGDRVAVLLALGLAQHVVGDRDAARERFLDAAARARAAGDATQLAEAALGLGGGLVGFEVQLFDRQQLSLLSHALEMLPDDAPLRPFVLARLSVARSFEAPVAERAELSGQAVELARAGGDPVALAAALAAHCDAIAGPDETQVRLRAACEIVGLAVEQDDVPLELLGRRLAVVAQLELGHTGKAAAEVDAYARLASSLQQPGYGFYAPMWRGALALAAGRFDEAADLLAVATAEGERASSGNADILCSTLRFWILAESGRTAEAVDFVVGLGDHPAWTSVGAQLTNAMVEAYAGSIDSARHRLNAVGLAGYQSLPRDSEWLPYLAGGALITSRISGSAPVPMEMAEWVYDSLLPYRRTFVVDGIGAYLLGSVERYLALLAAALDRPDDARTHFAAAVAANEGAGLALQAAATMADAARLLGDAEHYEQAIAAYEAMSCDAVVAELRELPAQLPEASGGQAPKPDAAEDAYGEFVCEGEYWRLTWAGRTVHVRDSKGMHDLAMLLAQPGREIPALDLTGAPSSGDLGEVIDARARTAYQNRLRELEEEIEEADAAGDAGRSIRAVTERDALIEQLTSAYGLGGRTRKAGDAGEKARSAVSWRIRHAIGRIADVHPALGKHLKHAVRTGRFVVYDPERPVTWTHS